MGYSLTDDQEREVQEFADTRKERGGLMEDYIGSVIRAVSIQPLGYRLVLWALLLLVHGHPTLVASAFGPAAAKITVLYLAWSSWNQFGMTGLSQQGSEFYQLSSCRSADTADLELLMLFPLLLWRLQGWIEQSV